MRKIIFLFLIFNLTTSAYDFGKIPQIRAEDIKINRAMMIMVGQTKCIWCESMAPQLKEIKEAYPKTLIYYINTDKDPLWAINNNISELPVEIFYNSRGVEIGRHVGYLGKDALLELLRESKVLVER